MLVEFRESLRQDVRFGLRTLRSRPAFTATVVAALALGIGPSALLLNLGLLLAFALMALVLTAEGLYGVMAYLVLQRTREIGVRVAFGASPAHVVALVLRQVGTLVGAGIALGIPLALALSRVVASQLFGIAPTEPAIYLATAALLAAVALVAVLVPIRRAVGVDPVVALQTVGLP